MMVCFLMAHGQIIKGSGVLYFDGVPNTTPDTTTSAAEIAIDVSTGVVYVYDRQSQLWSPNSSIYEVANRSQTGTLKMFEDTAYNDIQAGILSYLGLGMTLTDTSDNQALLGFEMYNGESLPVLEDKRLSVGMRITDSIGGFLDGTKTSYIRLTNTKLNSDEAIGLRANLGRISMQTIDGDVYMTASDSIILQDASGSYNLYELASGGGSGLSAGDTLFTFDTGGDSTPIEYEGTYSLISLVADDSMKLSDDSLYYYHIRNDGTIDTVPSFKSSGGNADTAIVASNGFNTMSPDGSYWNVFNSGLRLYDQLGGAANITLRQLSGYFVWDGSTGDICTPDRFWIGYSNDTGPTAGLNVAVFNDQKAAHFKSTIDSAFAFFDSNSGNDTDVGIGTVGGSELVLKDSRGRYTLTELQGHIIDTTEITATTTVVYGEWYLVNVSSGTVELDLPSGTPNVGDSFKVSDSRGNSGTNNIEIDFFGASDKLYGATLTGAGENYFINGDFSTVTFTYVSNIVGWVAEQ